MTTSDILQKLDSGSVITEPEFHTLLSAGGADGAAISEAARRVTDRTHGRRVLVRGLLEISNRCRNNCLYCGIRAANAKVRRYALTAEEIVESCRAAEAAGFRSFVLQGGEMPASDSLITRAVSAITAEMSHCAVTLSLGERPESVYSRWRRAGASRYLLRHETALASHYSTLHPEKMKLTERIACLQMLKRLGYQTGAGMMIGSPGQTPESLVADLMLLQQLRPEMVGIGPFIPHPDTPLSHCPAGSVELTLRLISITRLLLPHANIPSTTALATLAADGRERGLLAGANVVMPNITPQRFRSDYELYSRKKSSGAEAMEGLEELKQRVESAGLLLDFSRGDYKE